MRKMSREELAETLDLTVSHMGLIERGERGATPVTLEKLSQIFGIKIDDFFMEKSKGLSIGEGGENDNELAASRHRVVSHLNRLNKEELDYIANAAKGLISIKPIRGVRSIEEAE
jgi:transcriptional regulator with XRE-family HTH domain